MDWVRIASLASAAATLVTMVAVVITVCIYVGQLKAMTKARQLDSLLVIMRYADDLQLRRARYFMIEHGDQLAPLLAEQCTPATRSRIDKMIREQTSDELSIHHIDLSLNALNNIGFLIRHNYTPPEAVHGFMKNTLLHGWRAFEPYIRYRRTRDNTIGEPSRYGEHLEWAFDKNQGP